MSEPHCHTCKAPIAGYNSVHFGSPESGYRHLCSRCYNAEMAALGEYDFEHVQFEPIELADVDGVVHRFDFRLRLLGDERVSLEAFEILEGTSEGYQFQVIDEAGSDPFAVLARLVERMRRALGQRHLEMRERFGLAIKDFMVRGRIDCDIEADDRLPLLVIDGKEIPWDQFGRMIMSFEGWQFKLEIRDRSEEV
jgi:hypothetical protein